MLSKVAKNAILRQSAPVQAMARKFSAMDEVAVTLQETALTNQKEMARENARFISQQEMSESVKALKQRSQEE